MKIVHYTRLIAECNQQYNLYIQHTVKHAIVKYLNSHGCHRWRCRHHSATIKSIAFLTGKPKPFSSALLPPPIILISLIICTCIPLRLKWNCDHSLDVRHRSRFTYESSKAREKKSTQSERERVGNRKIQIHITIDFKCLPHYMSQNVRQNRNQKN